MHAIRRIGKFYAAGSAVLVGNVAIGEDSSVWHHCVLRGDVAPIRVGERTNIQDGSVLHCKHGVPLEVGSEVIIGHGAVVHCKWVGSRSLIGIHATVLDDAQVGEDCLIAAGTVVPPGMVIPDGSLVMGLPGRVTRPVNEVERAYMRRVVNGYIELARRHAAGEFKPIE